jgi:hypothetical protein
MVQSKKQAGHLQDGAQKETNGIFKIVRSKK